MSLEFTDFAHFYEDSGMTDAQQREDFEVYACFMECIVRHFWRYDPQQNSLGISLDSDTLAVIESVSSDNHIPATFNDAAHGDAVNANAL